jgi:hypothetical protein
MPTLLHPTKRQPKEVRLSRLHSRQQAWFSSPQLNLPRSSRRRRYNLKLHYFDTLLLFAYEEGLWIQIQFFAEYILIKCLISIFISTANIMLCLSSVSYIAFQTYVMSTQCIHIIKESFEPN